MLTCFALACLAASDVTSQAVHQHGPTALGGAGDRVVAQQVAVHGVGDDAVMVVVAHTRIAQTSTHTDALVQRGDGRPGARRGPLVIDLVDPEGARHPSVFATTAWRLKSSVAGMSAAQR